jgi:hypothetical protein
MSRGARYAAGQMAFTTQSGGTPTGSVDRQLITGGIGSFGSGTPAVFNPTGPLASSRMAQAPTGITDPLVASRYSEAVDLNPNALVTVQDNGWQMVRCDRPVILWPVKTSVGNSAVSQATLVSAGSTYSAADVLTVVGGTGTSAQITVDAVSGGAITAFTVTNRGSYSVLPTYAPATVTGGGGTGATFNFKWAQAASPTVYNSGSTRVIYYAPNRIPSSLDDAQRSKGAGIVYLPNPGQWYIQAARDTTAETVIVSYLVIDAQDPAMAARYLSESGCHRIKTNASFGPIQTTSTQLLAENRNRTGLLLTSTAGPLGTPTIAKLRLGFGAAAVNNVGTEMGTSTTATFGMFGEACWKGSIAAVFSDTQTAGGSAYISVVEWE